MEESSSFDDSAIEYRIHISLIPPYNEGCYFRVYYEDTKLEDKIYLLQNKEIVTQNNIWNMKSMEYEIDEIDYDNFLYSSYTRNNDYVVEKSVRKEKVISPQNGKLINISSNFY